MKNTLFIFLSILFFSKLHAQTELVATDQEGLAEFTIVDPKGVAEGGAVVVAEAVDKKFTKKAVADINGKCGILIPEGAPFKLIVQKFGEDFDFGVQNIPIKAGPQTSGYRLSIELITTYKRTYVLQHLLFPTNEFAISSLNKTSVAVIDRLVDSLNANPRMKIEVAGHTDNSGDDQANMQLSQKRADAIKGYLIQKGIKAERLLAKGYGEVEPVASNDTPEGRAFNRRTEVKIIEE